MELHRIFGVELPVIQAPMAGVQLSALAIAVGNAGGLGSLPCAMLDAMGMRKELAIIAEKTNQPINVNFFCHTLPVADAARDQKWRDLLAPFYAEFDIDPATIPTGPSRPPITTVRKSAAVPFQPPPRKPATIKASTSRVRT